ncbi:hypothetical protein AFLA_010736 [Aspergillus flavus NRRL3357]|nr:hypothetical protein AFLA_010736 [Aspergillus flavus NRRL3357]
MRYGQFCYIWKGLAQDLDSLDREAFSGEGKVCDSFKIEGSAYAPSYRSGNEPNPDDVGPWISCCCRSFGGLIIFQ